MSSHTKIFLHNSCICSGGIHTLTFIHSDDYTWLQNSYFYGPTKKFEKAHNHDDCNKKIQPYYVLVFVSFFIFCIINF